MYFVLEDPMASGHKIEPPLAPGTKQEAPPAGDSPRFSVSEGAEQYVGFWLVVLGVVGFLALIALVGFGPH